MSFISIDSFRGDRPHAVVFTECEIYLLMIGMELTIHEKETIR